jgi:hypothetical protein
MTAVRAIPREVERDWQTKLLDLVRLSSVGLPLILCAGGAVGIAIILVQTERHVRSVTKCRRRHRRGTAESRRTEPCRIEPVLRAHAKHTEVKVQELFAGFRPPTRSALHGPMIEVALQPIKELMICALSMMNKHRRLTRFGESHIHGTYRDIQYPLTDAAMAHHRYQSTRR